MFGGFNGFGNNSANNTTDSLLAASMINGNNGRNDLAMGEEFLTRDIFGTNQNISATANNTQQQVMSTGGQTQRDVLESRYTTQLGLQQLQNNMQECCCSTKQQVMQNNYDNAIGQANLTREILLGQASNQKDYLLGNQGIQSKLAECCCDIKTAINADGEATRDLIQQHYISELSDKLNVARSQISNYEQSQYLLNSIGRYNVVSVPPMSYGFGYPYGVSTVV